MGGAWSSAGPSSSSALPLPSVAGASRLQPHSQAAAPGLSRLMPPAPVIMSGQSRVPSSSQATASGLSNPQPPTTSTAASSTSPAPSRDHPMVDFERSSSEDENVIDEKRITAQASRAEYRRTHRVERNPAAAPAPGQGATFAPIAPPPPATENMNIAGWPYHLLSPPTDSNPRLTGHWYNYVPMMAVNAANMTDAARHDTGETSH